MHQDTAKKFFIVLSAMIVIVPAVINQRAYDVTGIKIIIFFCCSSVLSLFFLFEKKLSIKPAMLLPLVYVLWASVSALMSPYKVFTIMPLITMISLYIIFSASALLPDKYVYVIRSMIIISCIIPLGAGVLQLIMPDLFAPMMQFGSRIPSLFGNPNFFGAWLVIVFPVLMWRGFYGLGMQKWINLVLAALCGLMIVFTGSKAAAAGFIAEILIFGLYFVMQRGKTAAAFFISIIFLMLSFVMTVHVIKLSVFTKESFFFRQQVWKGTVEMIKTRPITGFGPGAFAVAFPSYRPAEIMKWAAEDEYEITYPENFLLQSGAETGIPGMLIAAALFIFAVYLGLKEEKEALDFGAAIAGIIVVNFFGVDMNYISTSAFVAIYAGVLAGGSREKKGLTIKNMWLAAIFAFIFAVYGLYASVKKEISSNYLAAGMAKARIGLYEDSIYFFDRAVAFNGINLDAIYFMGKAFYDSGNKEKSVSVYEKLQSIAPFFVSLQLKLADIYMEKGMLQEAKNHYKRMLDVNPYSEAAAYGMAKAAFMLDNPVEAEKYVQKAIEKHANSHTLYNALGNLKMKKMDFKGAFAAYKKAVDLSPSEDYHYNLIQAEKFMKKAEK